MLFGSLYIGYHRGLACIDENGTVFFNGNSVVTVRKVARLKLVERVNELFQRIHVDSIIEWGQLKRAGLFGIGDFFDDSTRNVHTGIFRGTFVNLNTIHSCLLIALQLRITSMRAWCEQCNWELRTDDGLTPLEVCNQAFKHMVITHHYSIETNHRESMK